MMMKRMMVVSLMIAACGKGKGGDSAPSVSVTKADADAVNALVPADAKAKFDFEVRKIEDKMGHRTTTYTVVAPKGWKNGFMPGSLEPAEEAHGFGMGKTDMKVGSNCDGDCKPKDWAAVVDKVYYAQFTSGQVKGKVVKDDKQKTSRTLVFENQPTVEKQGETEVTTGTEGVTIIRTWWLDGASKHYSCQASLNKDDAKLAPAFEQACAKVAVSGD
jgi:hypothetical protein